MQNFDYKKISKFEEASQMSAGHTRFLAGGTTLIDLMKLDVETPKTVVDLRALPLREVKPSSTGGLQVGALVTNAELAHHERVLRDYPILSQAILAGASPQLRNKATTGGNLLQRTRCVYFRDTSRACNKREPQSGCPAIGGHNRNLAILGTSEHCIANNPSDMNVAMMALEAQIHVQGKKDKRDIAIGDFYLLPGETPQRENILQDGDLITGVTLPAPLSGSRSVYLKLRDRASYEFALASAAVIVRVNNGHFEKVRIAMGGIGTRPWRAQAAEKILEGSAVTLEKMQAAADETLREAKPQSQNAFKIELAKRCLVQALRQAAGLANGQPGSVFAPSITSGQRV